MGRPTARLLGQEDPEQFLRAVLQLKQHFYDLPNCTASEIEAAAMAVCLEQQKIPLLVVVKLTVSPDAVSQISPPMADVVLPCQKKIPDACFSLRQHCHVNECPLTSTGYDYDDGNSRP